MWEAVFSGASWAAHDSYLRGGSEDSRKLAKDVKGKTETQE